MGKSREFGGGLQEFPFIYSGAGKTAWGFTVKLQKLVRESVINYTFLVDFLNDIKV